MVFTKDSFLVQFWLKQVHQGVNVDDVPVIFNLKDVVASLV